MTIVENYNKISQTINTFKRETKLIVVTKGQDLSKIDPLIQMGHHDFGENRVQEAKLKWEVFLSKNQDINLHFIGKLQSNKIKGIGELFKFIHSLDNIKNADLLAKEEIRTSKKLKYFIQVNLAKEIQKSGIEEEQLSELIFYCKKVSLNVIGLMCIPPINSDASVYFKRLKYLASNYSFNELSMGMSDDYKDAISNGATYVRIGSLIFKEN